MALSDSFLTKGREMGQRMGMSFTQFLFVSNHESGLNPAAHNPNGDASGLIQFMPRTLEGYGMSPEEMRSLSAEEQLPYIERFLSAYKNKRLDFMGRIHQALYVPASLDEGYGLDQVLTRRGGTKWGGSEASAYASNAKAFDPEGKGYITPRDLEAADLRAARNSSTLLPALARLKQLFPSDYKTPLKVWLASSAFGAAVAGGVYWFFLRKGARPR